MGLFPTRATDSCAPVDVESGALDADPADLIVARASLVRACRRLSVPGYSWGAPNSRGGFVLVGEFRRGGRGGTRARLLQRVRVGRGGRAGVGAQPNSLMRLQKATPPDKTKSTESVPRGEAEGGPDIAAGRHRLTLSCPPGRRPAPGRRGTSAMLVIELHPQLAPLAGACRPAKLTGPQTVQNDRGRERCVSWGLHPVPG